MANGKKWYEYFVTIEGQGSAPEEASAESSAAQQIAAIAASVDSSGLEQKVAEKAQAAPAGAAGKTLSFEEIYEAAEIRPAPHGYSVLKVSEMLDNPHIKELPAEVKRSSVMVALDAAGVKVQEIVEDAVKRDKALDAFERLQQKQIEDLEAAKLEENRRLQTELDKLASEYKAKIQTNNDSLAQRKESFYAWRLEKQKLEQKISDTVSHFVTENPITTSTAPRPAPSAAAKTGI
jgi:Asp-tRNA(Asn)/Glu-tRNA(Gln) amidotransferase A subunit family amidase